MNHGQTTSSSLGGAVSKGAYVDQPRDPALELIRKRLGEVREHLIELHGVADRACGPRAEDGSTLTPIPNGLLDQIDQDLDIVVGLASSALHRLRRVA